MESPNYGQQNSARPYCLETPRQILPCGHDLCPSPARWPHHASQPTVCHRQCQFGGGLGQPQPGARPASSPQRSGLNYEMGPHDNVVLEANITYRSMYAQQAADPPPPMTPIPARRPTYQASPPTFPRTSRALSSSSSSSSSDVTTRRLRLLEEVKIEELPEEDRSCSICYHDFGVQNPEGIRELPLRLVKCEHVFGEVCIKRWFEEKESDKCPSCRDELVVETE